MNRSARIAAAVVTMVLLGAPAAQALTAPSVSTSTRIACVGADDVDAFACVDERVLDVVDTPTLPRP